MTTRIDTYTKTVLTVIAGCLLWISFMLSGEPLKAQPQQYSPLPAQPVVVVGWGRLNPSAPDGIEIAWSDPMRKVSEPALQIRPATDPKFEPIPVRVDVPMPLPVSLEAVRKGREGAWDALRTSPDADQGSRLPGIRDR